MQTLNSQCKHVILTSDQRLTRYIAHMRTSRELGCLGNKLYRTYKKSYQSDLEFEGMILCQGHNKPQHYEEHLG